MSTATMDRKSVRYFQTALASRTVEETSEGGKVIKSVPVFRTGTFKDSMGDQHTWEMEHLTQMVFHFELLRDNGVLPNVPMRNGHKSLFGGGGDVVGYVADLRIEGEDAKGNALLVADLEFTEPDAFGKVERGTWRSRSSEIGFYETNDESMYWPVFMGVAWVDIPAVEGLFSKQRSSDDEFIPVRDDDEEGAVSHAKSDANKGGAGTGTPPATNDGGGSQHGAPPADDPKEGGDGEGNPEGAGEGSGQPAGSGASDHGAPPAASAGTTVTAGAGGTAPAGHKFSINGQETADFAAVQAHINNLEAVLSENRDQARRDFVTELAQSNRIAATQVDGMTEHALSLTDEQYEAFKKMYEDAPESPLFSHHGQGTTTDPEGSSESEVETLRERVKLHQRSGMSEEKVKETQSYKRLMELTDNKG